MTRSDSQRPTVRLATRVLLALWLTLAALPAGLVAAAPQTEAAAPTTAPAADTAPTDVAPTEASPAQAPPAKASPAEAPPANPTPAAAPLAAKAPAAATKRAVSSERAALRAAAEDADEGPGIGALDQPWDYAPYRVQIWLAGDDPRVKAAYLAAPLRQYLERDFLSLWRMQIDDAPLPVAIAAARDIAALDYPSLTAADPVIAVKRNHPEAPRIRFAADIGTFVKRTFSTADRIDRVTARAAQIGNPDLGGAAKTFQAISGDALSLVKTWSDPETEALLLSRGMAKQLNEPEAKIVSLPLENLAAETIDRNDKLFIVHVDSQQSPWTIAVVEVDCLMRSFSVVHRVEVVEPNRLAEGVGRAVTEIFAPVIRIEEAGQRTAEGLVRAFGLITDEQSPAAVRVNDFFVPMVRKDDRNGDPVSVGPLDWAFLHVKEANGARLKLDYHAGKSGSLQGRANKRTFRTATRIRPLADATIVRLHAQRNPKLPLIGYEFFERPLDSKEMTFVGRADWDGKIRIEKTDSPLRLLYVKNGGAVLARLPVVPGQSALEVADLIGDDQRLRAEAYVRGTQKAIVDLVAIRQLFAARIRLRLEQGKTKEAKELLEALRNEPTYEKIADDMGRKLVLFTVRNASEQSKINRMFAQTREMLVKNINEQLIRELENAVYRAETGKPAPPPTPAASETPAAASPPTPDPVTPTSAPGNSSAAS